MDTVRIPGATRLVAGMVGVAIVAAAGCAGGPGGGGSIPEDAGTPTCRAEACNGADDDCDGAIDETIAGGPLCLPVAATSISTPLAPCASVASELTLTEVATARGVTFDAPWIDAPLEGARDVDVGGGMVVSDLTGDGFADLLLTAPWGVNALYLNDGTGSFDLAAGSAFEAVEGTVAASAADLDGDGLREVFLITHAAVRAFWNQGGGSFAEGPPLHVLGPGERASFLAWTDFDGDGRLDVYIGRAGACFVQGVDPCRVADVVLHGLGGGAFEDVSDRFGAPEDREGVSMAGSFADLDQDGDLDFLLVNDVGSWHTPNRFFENRSGGAEGLRFVESSDAYGLDVRMDGMGVGIGDLTTEGSIEMVVSDVGKVKAFAGDGNAPFQERLFYTFPSLGPGAMVAPASWAVELADLDLDADLEVIVAWHHLYPTSWWDAGADPALLPAMGTPLGNTVFQSGTFGYFPVPDLTADQPASWFWHTASPVDLDGDGTLEIVFASMMGPTSIQAASCITGRHALEVSLEQPDLPSNRDALGARLEVVAGGVVQRRTLGVGSTGCLSGREPMAHFGLGGATDASLSVVWPDGRRTEVGTVPADHRVRVTRLPDP